jgi:hypothetical protein
MQQARIEAEHLRQLQGRVELARRQEQRIPILKTYSLGGKAHTDLYREFVPQAFSRGSGMIESPRAVSRVCVML